MNKWLSILLCLCLTAGLFAGCKPRMAAAPDIDPAILTVTPPGLTDGTIPTEVRFSVGFDGGKPLSTAEAEQVFRFDPPVEFRVTREDGTLILEPKEAFPENSIVNLQVLDSRGTVIRSFAYQTQAGFAVERVTPGDDRDYVPTDTGVEVHFTSPFVTVEDFASHFTLTNVEDNTPVAGHAEKFVDTLVFVPDDDLLPDTCYEARVSASLATPDGVQLGEDYAVSFNTAYSTGDTWDYFSHESPIIETFVTGDAPIIAVSCSEIYNNSSVDVSIYRFRSGDDYAAVLEEFAARRAASTHSSREVPRVDTASLDSLGTFQQPLVTPGGNEHYYGPRFVQLPADFEKGWYYVTVSVDSPVNGRRRTLHKLLQISDLSVYYAQTNGSTLFWLNNAVTSQSIPNAQISVSGGVTASGASDARGVAQLDTAAPGEDDAGALLDIRSGEERFLEVFEAQNRPPKSVHELYLSYLYTDRPIYMASDTMRCWGLVRPRAGAGGLPENLRVSIMLNEDELYSVPVTPAANGIFTAELPFQKLGVTSYSVALLCGEKERLASKYVNVGDYVKPATLPSFSFDRPFYCAGDEAVATFTTTYFDGTPASGYSANVRLRDDERVLTTDASGVATESFPIPEQDGPTEWRAQTSWYNAANSGGENENFYLSNTLPVFYRDLMLRGDVDGGTNALTIRTNAMDFSGIRLAEDVYDEAKLTGPARDVDVTVTLHRRYVIRTENGSYYDFIRKRNVTRYDYRDADEVVETRTVRTQNGTVTLTDLPRSSSEGWYYCELTAPDGKGRTVTETVWLASDTYFYYPGLDNYSFSKRGVKDRDYRSLTSFTEDTTYFDLVDNGMPVDEGRVFYTIATRGFLMNETTNSTSVAVPFTEELAPNYRIGGAYFDGRYVFKIDLSYMKFDPSGRTLDIEVATDRERYAPGDTAQVSVTVTDGRTGAPAANAAVSVSVVDEAVFAIEDQLVTPLEDLYREVDYPRLTTFASYIQYNFSGASGAEKGGGGGDGGVRSDFQDTVALLTATTDESGRASFTIALPDNITSWRATVQAVTDDLHAGDTRHPIVVTGRFFLSEVLATHYLSGDDAQVTLRCAGEAAPPDAVVDYTVTVATGDEKAEYSASGKAQDFTAVPLGKLRKGTYTVTMAAKSGDVQDAVEKTITVVDAGVEASVVSTFDLADGVRLEAERFPVTLGFYNEAYRDWAAVLDFVSRSYGSRTDERIARRFVGDVMERMSGEGEELGRWWGGEDDLLDVVSPEYGAVSLFPYDSESLELAARAHLAVPDYVTGTGVFYDSIGRYAAGSDARDPDTVSLAYLGLAAHKEPVLGKVRNLLASPETLSDKAKLRLIAALAALGDSDGAAGYYREHVRPLLTERELASGETALFVDRGDENESIEYTALASLSASMTRSSDATGMMRYLMNHRSTLDLYLLEQIVYLRHMEPQGGEKASVSYRRNGKTQTLDLGRMGMRFARFVYEDFDKASVKRKSGDVSVKAFYTTGIRQAQEELGGKEKNDLAVSRTMEVVGGGEMKAGSVVKVRLRVSCPDRRANPYGTVVNDYIPSGMRWLGRVGDGSDLDGKGDYSNDWHVVSREGQRVSFFYRVYDDGYSEYDEDGNLVGPEPGEAEYPELTELVYYVRCAAPGDYVVGDAFARMQDGGHWGIGGAGDAVTIVA